MKLTHLPATAALLLAACLGASGCVAVSRDAYDRDMTGMKHQQDWLEAQKRQLNGQLTDSEDKLKEANSELTTCKKERGVCQNELIATKDKLKRIATSCGKAGVMLTECEAREDTLKGDIARLKQENSVLSVRLTKIQAKLDRLLASIERVRQKLAAMVASGKLKVSVKNGFLVIQLQADILFDTGKAKLKEAAKPVLLELASVLKGFKGRRFQVAGHTDPRGSDEVNWRLSTQRSVSVVSFLTRSGGVPPQMLSAGGYASYLPVTSNDTEEGMRQNRRVEFLLLPDLSELLELAGLKKTPSKAKSTSR